MCYVLYLLKIVGGEFRVCVTSTAALVSLLEMHSARPYRQLCSSRADKAMNSIDCSSELGKACCFLCLENECIGEARADVKRGFHQIQCIICSFIGSLQGF